jgi:hypothetical protein
VVNANELAREMERKVSERFEWKLAAIRGPRVNPTPGQGAYGDAEAAIRPYLFLLLSR